MMVSNVRGEFEKMTGTAYYDPSSVADEVDIILDVELVKKRLPKQTSSLQ